MASAAFAVILVLGHAAASARANSANAQALQAALEDVRSQAYIDVLTTLSNRRMFNLDFRKFLANSVRHQIRFALILIDLDGLKQVNDRFGHEPGDEILVQSSVRLRALIRATDSLARLGGDEFAILAADINDPAALHAICDRIVAAFEPEFTFGGKVLRCTVSVGVAIFPDHGDDQDALYKASDLALYTAKNAGRNTWRIFSQTPSA